MPFQVGDYFGKFRLDNKIDDEVSFESNHLSRWEANDTISSKTVVLDIVEQKSDSDWFNTSVPADIVDIGYNQVLGCFFWVWKDRDKAQVNEVSTEGLSEETARQVVESLTQIHLTLNEQWGKENPKPYLFNDSHLVLFYQKELTAQKDEEQNSKLLEGWINLYSPINEEKNIAVSIEDAEKSPSEPEPELLRPTPPLPKWPFLMLGVFLVVFLLWKWWAATSPPHPPLPNHFDSFNLALNNGITAYKDNDEKQAEKYFKEAADYAKSINPKPSRLDSLASSFRKEADDKCAQFKAAQSPNLFYIPNQSYKFVEILTGEPCQTCK